MDAAAGARRLLTARLLVFVDTMKELPATLIVRPFDFDTLAVGLHPRLRRAPGRGRFPALAIVAVGILPVIVLSIAAARARPGEG